MGFGKKPDTGKQPENKAVTPPPAPPPATTSPTPTPPPKTDTENKTASPTPPSKDAPPSKESMEKIAAAAATEPIAKYTNPQLETDDYRAAKQALLEELLEKIDFDTIEKLPEKVRRTKIIESATELIRNIQIPLNDAQHALLIDQIIDEVLGFGPLELLMKDPDVSDVMVNTCKQVYLEKFGKIMRCDVTFISERHLLSTIQKIVSLVGRRVDETSPMVDARMPDGSRFNAIIPPLALDGSLVSIRKFKQNKMPLSQYVDFKSMSPQMCRFLEICGNIRLNIMISGGTGSGKTTMLNALSGHIDPGERVITIEDAAELQLHQPHVLRLETRPANMEGTGEITQRMLVKNALRMRPDRIILGEIRSDEVIDVLAAMNTGHEGSMATIHANNPRDCLSRIENLVGMAGITLPIKALRYQIASAIHLIVQVSRMRDGTRRVTHIEEIVGMEGDIITTQQIFGYKPGPMSEDGKLTGHFFCTGIKPKFFEQAMYFNRDKELNECLQEPHQVQM